MASLILLAALALPAASARRAPQAPVELTADPEPAVAAQGQPVSLKVRWKSRVPAGGQPVRLNRRGLLGREVVIRLRCRGKEVRLAAPPPDLGPPGPQDYQTLGPGEAFEYEYPLAPAAGALPAGRCDARVTYRNDHPGDPPAWTGSLEARASFFVRK